MSATTFRPYGIDTCVLDLQRGEDSLFVNDNGGVEVQPDFEHDLYLRLGSDILTISRISAPEFPSDEPQDFKRAHNMYAIRSMLRGTNVIFHDGLVAVDFPTPEPGTFAAIAGFTEAHTGPSLMIGRRATPALELSESVDEEHLFIQVDAISRNLQITDLRSSSGTCVAVHNNDKKMLLEVWNSVPFYSEEKKSLGSSILRLFSKLFSKR